jgi:hypothetical protein
MILLTIACGRETAAPPAADTTAMETEAPAPQTASTPPVVVPPPASEVKPLPGQERKASYDDAIAWFRSTERFRFVLDEAGTHAEGDVARKTVGAETVTMTVGTNRWRASAGPRGVTWEIDRGGRWLKQEAPPNGSRLYQRVTLAFDPQKKEGAAQYVDSTATSDHFRFTDANTGNVHDAWVNRTTGALERLTIGGTVDLEITP